MIVDTGAATFRTCWTQIISIKSGIKNLVKIRIERIEYKNYFPFPPYFYVQKKKDKVLKTLLENRQGDQG